MNNLLLIGFTDVITSKAFFFSKIFVPKMKSIAETKKETETKTETCGEKEEIMLNERTPNAFSEVPIS